MRDPAGNNLALVSRGAGVTVSSTSHGCNNDRYTQDSLWNPLNYDLGNKWVRAGGDNGSYMWHFTEHEKGKLEIDSAFDASITECVKHGVSVIMNLDFKGNWLYAKEPRKTDWVQSRFREFNDYYNDPLGIPPVTNSPEMFAAYLKYVECMVEHFKDRVAYFEIGNEWNAWTADFYMSRFFEPTYVAVKKIAPDAKIMLGSPAGFAARLILGCLGKGAKVAPGWGAKIDAIGWHPGNNPDAAYFQAVREIQHDCRALGFRGKFFATEIYAGMSYPPGACDAVQPVYDLGAEDGQVSLPEPRRPWRARHGGRPVPSPLHRVPAPAVALPLDSPEPGAQPLPTLDDLLHVEEHRHRDGRLLPEGVPGTLHLGQRRSFPSPLLEARRSRWSPPGSTAARTTPWSKPRPRSLSLG